MQLAGDGEGRRILWEENAIPLAIYMLGQSHTQQQRPGQAAADEDPLEAAKPALCALLQRLAAAKGEEAAREAWQAAGDSLPAFLPQGDRESEEERSKLVEQFGLAAIVA
jgi:hypothetical protein